MTRRPTTHEQPTTGIPGLPRSARATFATLFDQPLDPASWFRADIDRYLTAIRATAERREFVDLPLAERIGGALCVLLDALDHETPDGHRRAVYAAARYFVLAEDGTHDTHSEVGFYDDAEVLNAVAVHVGRADLVIVLPP